MKSPKFSLSRTLVAAAAGLALGAAALPASALPYSALYVFGDSLSDNGNVYALTGGAAPVSPPYAQRFSNGPVAVEYMATYLGLPLVDFAYGGAKSGAGNLNPGLDALSVLAGGSGTGVLSQIADFGAANFGAIDTSGLYFISAGPNDFFSMAPGTEAATITAVATNLSTAVMNLYGMGARHFLLPSIADLGLTASAYASGTQAAASGLSAFANMALDGAYASVAAALPDEQFIRIDTQALQLAALAEFGASGGVTVTGTCLNDMAFPDCAGYMFFDDVHPTTAVHYMNGLAMARAVPEPSAWLLAGVALLAVGAGTRRRKA